MEKRIVNTIVQIALVSSGLAALSPASALAQEPEASFRPAKAWHVGPVGKVSDYSGECLLQTEFNNGFILQFKGSSNWVQQLNINFRQNVFEAGRNYEAMLSVPGNAQKTLPASASEKNILSIPLKGHKDLFKEARKNAVLDASIEGNDFRFYLTGFGPAAMNFERCMAGGEMQEAAVQKPKVAEEQEPKDLIKPPPVEDAVINESIALEQEEAKMVGIGDIDAQSPETQDKKIPYSEDHEKVEYSPVGSVNMPKPAQKRPEVSPHKRLSDQLAEEIAANPDLVDTDSDAVVTQTLPKTGDLKPDSKAASAAPEAAKREPLKMPPSFEKQPPIPQNTAGSDVVTPEPIGKIVVKQPETPAIERKAAMPKPEPDLQPEVQASIAKKPATTETPPAPESVPEPVETPAAKTPKAELESNNGQLANIPALKGMRIIQSEPILPDAVVIGDVKEKKEPTPERQQDQETQTVSPKETGTPTTAEGADLLPLDGEEIEIKTVEAVEAVEAEPMIEPVTAPANEPTVEPAATPEAAQAEQSAAVTPPPRIKTPEMKVNKERYEGNADFSTTPREKARGTSALARIAAMEKEMEMLRAENRALEDELNVSLKEGEQERLEISSDNWNLERATMRYNEAERQIKRLGQQLQKERAQAAMEKKELEMMLFDPELTDQAQLARLSQLEKELEAARAELEALRAQQGVSQ